MQSYRRTRFGFTLIELLVVMSLMAVLAALAIRFLPSASASARESRAGMTVQGWLNIAKQRALRDQAPRGLRLFINPAVPVANGSNTVAGIVECQYLETPEDYSPLGSRIGRLQPPNAALLLPPFNMKNTLQIDNVDLLNGYTAAAGDMPNWSVQPGDLIELVGTGLLFKITGPPGFPASAIDVTPEMPTPSLVPPYVHFVAVDPPLPDWLLPLGSPNPTTTNYRIIRRPRPVGDEMLKLPAGTMIDPVMSAFTSSGAGVPANTNYIDIVFAPNGSVITLGMNVGGVDSWMPATGLSGKIHLYVRAPDANDTAAPPGSDAFHGDPTLISTYVHTGFVGAYPPARQTVPGTYSLVP